MRGGTNELQNLIEQVANSLESNILPHVTDHYAQLQVRAARELLLNLGTRIEWRRADIDSSARVLRAALVSPALARLSGAAPPAPGATCAEMRKELAALIGKLYAEPFPDGERNAALAEIWHVVRFEFDAEAARVRTGMFA